MLLSAQGLADHAARPGPSKIERDDVDLAIQMRRRYEFAEGPPRDVSGWFILPSQSSASSSNLGTPSEQRVVGKTFYARVGNA